MATANIYDLADTWNAGGTTFTAIKMNVTDTASAAASLLMDLQVGGSSKFSVGKAGTARIPDAVSSSETGFAYRPGNSGSGAIGCADSYYGVFAGSDSVIGFTSGSAIAATPDVHLRRDAANVLAQRNSTNAQTFRIYETFTDGSNYSRLGIISDPGNFAFTILTQAAGTGTSQELHLGVGSVSAAGQWKITTSGHFCTTSDNTYDIGASGATRPRNLYMGNGVFFPEVSDIDAPSANTGVIYMRDSGGKTQFVARFPSGAVQVIATEP